MKNVLEEIRKKVFSKYRKDSWEVKTLGEIALEIVSGNQVTKVQLGTGNHPAVKCGDINSSLPLQFKECISFVDPDLIKKPRYFEYGDVLMSKMGGKDTVGTVRLYLGKDKCLLGGDVEAIKHNQNPKYLSFVLSTKNVKNQIENLAQESTVFHLYTKNIKEIKIPLPPIEIQDEIVEFLDKFTKLEKELEMRKEQYEYYKELMFDRGINEENWEWKTIGEIATEIISGNGVTREQLGTGDYPTIKAGDVNSSLPQQFEECISFIDPNLIKKPKYFNKNDILISGLGSEKTIGKACVYLGNERCILGECVTSVSHNQNPKYLSFALSTKLSRKQLKEKSTQNQLFRLHASGIKQIQIPLPPLEEQDKVVEKLNIFYKIINDLKEGIPLLIQKNREQYNFYKEMLLEK